MKNNIKKLSTSFKVEEIPHNYYPRPQLKRENFTIINGIWDFTESENEIGNNYNEKILVPFPMESSLSKIERIHDKKKTLFYKKEFELKDFDKNEKRLILHIEASDNSTSIFVNDKYVNNFIGGYLPINVDISEFITNGINKLEFKIRDELSFVYPYGKQKYKRGGMWYTVVSGIWGTVWLEEVPINYIKNIKIDPSLDSLILKVNGGEKEKTLIFNDREYSFIGDTFTLKIDEPMLWTPETPNLYSFTLISGKDKIESYFALRTVSIGDDEKGIKRILLNNKPYFFNGLLDQGYFPDGIYMPPSIEGFEFDLKNIKKLGFNMIRKHIKIEPSIYYYLCDKIGIAVFQDMVNNGKYNFFRDTFLASIGVKKLNDKLLNTNKLTREVFEIYMLNTAKHLYNFPCIVYYTIFNEGWGQFCSSKMYDKLKEIDSTRIIDSASGWFKGGKNDVTSEHIYFKPIKLKYENKPIVLSEFGGYSYKLLENSFNQTNTYAYKFYSDKNEFMKGLENLYINQVLPYVEKGLCALVYTQTSDVEDETNGIFTYDRKVIKVDEEKMKNINSKFKL